MSALSAAASKEDGDTIKNLQARVADLEAQLYAVGAGGVGKMEQPQGEQEPVVWAEEIIEYLHAHYDTEMIKELDSGDALIRLDDAIAAVEEVAQRHANPQTKCQPLTDAQINDHRLALPYDGEDLPDPWDFQARREIRSAHRIGGVA